MTISFVGDIMLGRNVWKKYFSNPYELVSLDVLSTLKESDHVIANLESPITDIESAHILAFAGNCKLLEAFRWVSCFSLANNHINDFGEKGIDDTIYNLNINAIKYNGVYIDNYKPYIIEGFDSKIAVITCIDTINYPLKNEGKYKVLRLDSPDLGTFVKKYSNDGYFVILFAHTGNLFSRIYDNRIRMLLYNVIDAGAKCVVTCHSHCLGGMDKYRDIPIFHSLGDFLMDGASYRRRQSYILKLDIINNSLNSWDIFPTITNCELQTVFPKKEIHDSIIEKFEKISNKIQENHCDYEKFYKKQYKKEMLEHSMSTLCYLYKTEGLKGMVSSLATRISAVREIIDKVFHGSKNWDKDGIGIKE